MIKRIWSHVESEPQSQDRMPAALLSGDELIQVSTNREEFAQSAHSDRSLLPSIEDIIFLSLIYLMVVLLPNFLFDDGSTGWHLVIGQYVIDHLRIPHLDLVSYTFPNKPYVAHEWLFGTIAALLVQLGGLKLLAVAIASAIGLLFVFLYQDARRTGCHFLLALIIVLIGALASSVHWLARPHVFSFFGVYIFSRYLEAFHRNKVSARQVWIVLGLTMMVWSNAHPAFLLGFAMVVIYLTSEAIVSLVLPSSEERSLAKKRSTALLAVLVITVAASLVNPYGLALYSSVLIFLRPSGVLREMQEWMSPTFHGELHAIALELLFAAIVFGLVTSRRKPWLGQFLLVVAFAHLALYSMRNEPLFVIVAVPFIAELFVRNSPLALMSSATTGSPAWITQLKQFWERRARSVDAMEFRCTMHLVPLAVITVLAISCIADGRIHGVRPLVSSQFDPKKMPTTTLDYISKNHMRWDRGFNLDNWGGYMRYQTGQRVFMDDRWDFYGEDFYQRYVQTLRIQTGWQTLLDDYHVEWILLPKNVSIPLANLLQQTPGWALKAEDDAAYLFVRQSVQRRASL